MAIHGARRHVERSFFFVRFRCSAFTWIKVGDLPLDQYENVAMSGRTKVGLEHEVRTYVKFTDAGRLASKSSAYPSACCLAST